MSEDRTSTLAVYCCENSSYLAAEKVTDPAVLRDIEIIKLPCSGKVDTGLALKTLEKGYAGVLVLGCPVDNCKYIRGNERARKRVDKTRHVLAAAGLDGYKVHIDFMSSVDTHKFVRTVMEMKERCGLIGNTAAG